jgi:YVTN family beta-propeller protein
MSLLVIDGLDSLAGGARASRRRFTARQRARSGSPNQVAGTVSCIDPRTNKVVKTIRLGLSPHGLIGADGTVWVAVARELI